MKILETAISSAEVAEVTAIKIKTNVQAAPPFPRSATAAFGSTNPASTSISDILAGKPGNAGLVSSAKQASPIVVAHSHGIANHERPPSTYPGSAEAGEAEIALLKYPLSQKTVPKLPTMLMTKKIAPSVDCMVRYDPPAFPETGWRSAAATRRS